MSDENTPQNVGGESGGPVEVLRLKRSELAILRKYANRYPIVEGERQEVVDVVMDTLRKAETPRNKIAAAQTMVALDRVNLEEIKVYLAAKKDAADELKPAPAVSVNVTVLNVQSVLDEYSDVISAGRVSGEVPVIVGAQQPIHSPEANGKAS